MLRKTFTKPFFLLFFIILNFSAEATTYYVSNSGNDNNSGTSASSPWQTLNKVNSFKKFAPGDNILFNRGNTFYGSITVSNSGSSGNPITYGAYGSGAKPVITGFTTVTSWSNLGGNIWESSSAVSTLATCNIVSVSGVNTPMGRYPNTGYFQFQSHNGNTSITSSSLNGSTNWTGASIAIKKQRWYIETGTITGQSGSTLSYTDPKLFTPMDGWGFFIQNDPRTLDQQNEWYYNPSTKKLRIYSTSQPTNVKLATVENTFDNSSNYQYITIDNLAITGANSDLIFSNYGQYATVTNCDLSFAGINGIDINSLAPTFIGNTINNTGYNGIFSHQNGVGGVMKNNVITNTGLIPGTQPNDGGAAIYSVAANTVIEGNVVDNSGWGGIVFYGNNSIAKNNFVNHSCLIKDDCGGISTHGGFTGQQIIGNIVLNSIGNSDGSNDNTAMLGHGIFLDDLSNSVTVSGNSVAGCGGVGYDFHRTYNLDINNNTAFNNGTKGNWMKGAIMFQCDGNNPPFKGIKLNNNIFVARTMDQFAFFYYLQSTNISDITQFGVADNNYYARPINDTTNLILVNSNRFSLKGWQSYSGQDANSKASPKSITDVNDLLFEYNATLSSKTIPLDAKYIDIKGNSYDGSITLAPFSSAVLIKNGAASTQNLLPAVNPSGTVNGLDYNYYEASSYSSLPSFGSVTPVKTGTIANFDISPANRSTAFSFNFTGYINVPADGQYTFYTSSDDGSNLYIDNVLVVNNDGIHSTQEKSGTIGLKAGKHAISVGYFQQAGGTALSVNYAGPGISKQVIPASALYRVSQTLSLMSAVNPSGTSSGLDYSYYEASSYSSLPSFSTLTPVKTGTVANFDISPANRSTAYSFNFTGYIDIPADGQYTFYTTSDDGSNLYIDNVLVVNNDGLHSATEKSGAIGLKAGKHAISVGYFQQAYDQTLLVSYAGPGISKQVIPASVLSRNSGNTGLLAAVNPSGTVNGLDYSYYEASSYSSLPSFSSVIPVKTGSTANFDIWVRNRNTAYSLNFTGYVNVPADGQYTFYTTSDDGSNLYIDNVLVVNNDGLHGATEKSGVIGLKAGKHAISVGYFQQNYDQILSVSYAGPGISKQAIPSSALFRASTGSTLQRLAASPNATTDIASDSSSMRANQMINNSQIEGGMKVYPNPFNSSINIYIGGLSGGKSQLLLFDASGKVIWKEDIDGRVGSYHKVLNTSSFANGMYFLKLVQEGKSSVIELVKQP